VLPQAAPLEQRLGDIEARIDRLTHELLRWRSGGDREQPAEQRLAQLTEQCDALLKQWAAAGERQAHAVGELESRLAGWQEVETRLQRDVTWRFQGLERLIEQEWASLRRLHEEPTRKLREHAESLTEICVATAGSAQTGLERAEARLSTLEKDLHRRMDDLSRDLQAVLAELRQQGLSTLRGPASSWSLDEVTRLHQEIREGAGTVSIAARPRPPVVQWDDARPSPTPVEPSDAHPGADEPAKSNRSRWKWYVAVALLAVATGIAGGLAWSFYTTARLAAENASQAQHRAEAIATSANERIDAARHDAAEQIALARDAASKAQLTSDILAAPDLVRFNLVGGDSATRASAQLLWSRSRGLVFSGSRLPQPPGGTIYQVWMLTGGDPVSAGAVRPDPSGRVTLATDRPPDVARPVVGVQVTLEPAPGGVAPTGATVLARYQ